MRITVLSVGKLKEKYLKDGIAEYKKRLSRFCDIDLIEVDDEQAAEKLSEAQEQQVILKEGEKLLKRLKADSFIVALDLKGSKLDSKEFADKISNWMLNGASQITFVIGGSLGLDSRIISRADFRLCMSDMTFPHQLARLVLMEQIFRAFKIMNGEP